MGEPTGVESECKIYSSILREVGLFTSRTDGISIEAGIDMSPLPLLEKGVVESVSAFISDKTNLGFMISASVLSIDVSPKWIWVEYSCEVNYSSGTLALDCVVLG